MDNFNCQYDDVVEAVDLYNLDVVWQPNYHRGMIQKITLFPTNPPKKFV